MKELMFGLVAACPLVAASVLALHSIEQGLNAAQRWAYLVAAVIFLWFAAAIIFLTCKLNRHV